MKTKPISTASVISFSPQGEVRSVRQVVIGFSHDMVALGRAGVPAPAQIDCQGIPAPSQRWVDARRWVAEFKKALPVGVSVQVHLQPGLCALDGTPVTAAGPWQLDTGGPKVDWQHPQPGQQVTEQQVFLLQADAPLARDSLAGALLIQVADQAAQAVEVLGAEDSQLEWKRAAIGKKFKSDRSVALRCTQPLPPNAQVQLVWGGTVATATGHASASDQIIGPWQVRPPFTARLLLGQVACLPGCNPLQGLCVEFSEDVWPALLTAASLRDAQGACIPLQIGYGWGSKKVARRLTTTDRSGTLLPEASTLTLHLPGDLVDVDGRPLANAADFPLPIPVARLPPYLGFAQPLAVLPWRAGQAALLPLAVRRLETSVMVQTMRLGG